MTIKSKNGFKKIARLTGHSAPIYALETGREEHLFFTGSGDNMVAEWSLKTMAPEPFAIKLQATVYSLCHIPDKKILLIGQALGGIHVIDLESKKEIRHLSFHNNAIFDIKYDHVHHHFIAASADGSITIWDAEEYSLLRHLPLCEGKVRNIAIKGEEICFACGDGHIKVFSTDSYQLLYDYTAHGEATNALKYHPSKPLLVSGGKDAFLRFWNTKENYRQVMEIPAHNFAIYSIDFNPDGKYGVTGSRDKTAKIWNASTFDMIGRIDRKIDGHTHSVNKVLWCNYRNYLLTTGDDRIINVWNIN